MRFEKIRSQLAGLYNFNAACSTHFHSLLRDKHKVGLWSHQQGVHSSRRGTAIFAAFDPINTCLRVVPGSIKYFSAAEKERALTKEQGLFISRSLLAWMRIFESRHANHFPESFDTQEIRAFLDCTTDEQIKDVEGTYGACADVFYQAVFWPVRAENHLISRTVEGITFSLDAPTSPARSLADAVEAAAWGPWIGFEPKSLCRFIEGFQGKEPVWKANILHTAGHRIVIPFFSNGFQGMVAGLFLGLHVDEIDNIRSDLLQFGQTLADKWALTRNAYLWQTVRDYNGDVDLLAEALIHAVSPIASLIVEIDGQTRGYRLNGLESDWSGFVKLGRAEMEDICRFGADITLVDKPLSGCRILINNLKNHEMIDQYFARLRVEMLLEQPTSIVTVRSRNMISEEFLTGKIQSLVDRIATGKRSVPVLRQLYVANKILQNIGDGQIMISNLEILKHLEQINPGEKNSGYQISSYQSEITKIFDGHVRVNKSRNGIILSWRPEIKTKQNYSV